MDPQVEITANIGSQLFLPETLYVMALKKFLLTWSFISWILYRAH